VGIPAHRTPAANKRWAGTSTLQLSVSADAGKRYVPFLKSNLLAAHHLLKPALSELSIALVDAQTMSQLHQQYMGDPSPTDVLTFELEHGARRQVTAGEVVVCVPVARREAKQRGTPVAIELLLYALHGMLHLCGYDDGTTAAYTKMHATEDQILKRLGVGPAFSAAIQHASPRFSRKAKAPSGDCG
jgi:rRNA maturation RNase YbeY